MQCFPIIISYMVKKRLRTQILRNIKIISRLWYVNIFYTLAVEYFFGFIEF